MITEITPHVTCVASSADAAEAINNFPEVYIQNPNGEVLKHLKLSGGRFARLKVDRVPQAVKDALATPLYLKPELGFLPAGKVPKVMFDQIVQFFRDVIAIKKSQIEAHAWILWSQEQGYFICIPKQTVSGASVSFTYEDIPKGAVIVVDIHSHNTMG